MLQKGLLICCILLLFACSKEAELNDSTIALYRLEEMLSDPGDGSGTFQSVNSGRNIEFLETDHIMTNSDICRFDTTASSIQLWEIHKEDSTILADACTIRYSVQGEYLFLYYPCIEPCIAKYKKD